MTSERPAGRAPARWAFDVFVVMLAAAAALPNLFHAHRDPTATVLDAVLLAVAVLPLLLRGIWPVPVFLAVLTVSGVLVALHPGVVAAFGIDVALYTVAALRPRREAFWCAGLAEAVVLAIAPVFPAHSFWNDALLLSLTVLASGALGLYVATRRAYLSELRERADRLERERDQQVALAAAAERARIAREMHDVVAHNLTVMVALSDGAIAASAKSSERGVAAMRTVSATGRRALADTRRLLGVLREDDDAPRAPLPDLDGLDELIDRVRAAGLPVTVEIHGAKPDLPRGVELAVYRLVQEGLTNTLKHGGPRARALVRMDHLADEVRVEIEDDGLGARASVPAGVGGGLAGMRERAHAYGGELDSGPRPQGGWRVVARFRLGEAAP